MSHGAFFCLFINSSKQDNSCTCVVISAGGGIRFSSLRVFLPAVHPRICERLAVFPGCSAFRSCIECQLLHALLHQQTVLIVCVFFVQHRVNFVCIMHQHIPKLEHQLWQPVVCTALPPHVVMGLGTIPFVNQMKRFTVVLHLHRTWQFRLISVFPSNLILRSIINPTSNTSGLWKFDNVLTFLLSDQTTQQRFIIGCCQKMLSYVPTFNFSTSTAAGAHVRFVCADPTMLIFHFS
jgi:hypothetical protein